MDEKKNISRICVLKKEVIQFHVSGLAAILHLQLLLAQLLFKRENLLTSKPVVEIAISIAAFIVGKQSVKNNSAFNNP